MATTATQSPADKVGAATQSAYEAVANAASTGTEYAAGAAKAFLPPIEETVERIRQVNEKLIASSKSAGRASLDAYDRALETAIDFGNKFATTSQVDWVSASAAAHTKFVSDISSAYTSAARDLLK